MKSFKLLLLTVSVVFMTQQCSSVAKDPETQKKLDNISSNVNDIKGNLAQANQSNPDISNLSAQVNALSGKLDAIKADLNKPAPAAPAPAPTAAPAPAATPVSAPADNSKDLASINEGVSGLQKNLSSLSAQFSQLNKSVLEQRKKAQDDRDKLINQLMNQFKTEIADGSISIIPVTEASFKIKINNSILFGKGEVSLTKDGEKAVRKISVILKKIPKDKEIYIIGHADKTPITSKIMRKFYPTNWELSTKRAIIVLRYLTEKLKFSPDNITAAGKSFFDPVSNSSSKKDMSLNRRTEIWVSPKIEDGEPLKSTAKGTNKESPKPAPENTNPQ